MLCNPDLILLLADRIWEFSKNWDSRAPRMSEEYIILAFCYGYSEFIASGSVSRALSAFVCPSLTFSIFGFNLCYEAFLECYAGAKMIIDYHD